MGPEATTKVSIGPDVGAKLTDSVGLVCWADEKVVLLSVREVSETMVLKANVELLMADDGWIRALETESSKSVITGERHIVSCLANRVLVQPDPEILVCHSGRTNDGSEMFNCPRTCLSLQSHRSSMSSAPLPGVKSNLSVTPCHVREHLRPD